MIRRSALVAAAALAVIIVSFLAVRSTRLWYWTPLTERSLLKLYALDTDPRKFDALVLGASVADFGFYPAEMESELDRLLPKTPGWSVYNASIQAAFLPTYLEILRNIAGHAQQPRAAVLALTLRDFNGSSNRVHRQVRFFARSPGDFWLVLRRAGNPRQRWAAVHALTHGLEALIQTPAYPFFRDDLAYFRAGHGKILVGHYPVLSNLMERDMKGDLPAEVLDRLRTRGVAEFRTELMNDFAINGLIDTWFREIIAEARKKDVRLAVALMPESGWFAEHAYQGEKEEVVEYLQRVCAETATPFYDLRDPRFRPRDEEFFDRCDHLAAPGAARFSAAVARHVLAPLLGLSPAPAATPPAEGKPVPGKLGAGAAPSPPPP